MIRSRSIGIAIALLSLLLPSAAARADISSVSSPTTDIAMQPAAVVVISGTIDDVERDSFMRRFAKARAAGAKTVIVEIDTYGGLVTSALEMSRYIKRQDKEGVRTIAFVRDKAISAGAMIAFACDEIVMQPHAQIGDCAPIMYRYGSVDAMPPTERAKAESPVLADFLDSAQRNKHDPKLAEAMVVLGHSIRFVENTAGERRIVNDDGFKLLAADGWKVVGSVIDPINAADKLLTIHSATASAIGLSSGEFGSREALAKARHLRIADTFEPTLGEEILGWLGTTIARLILLVIFILSLKIALSAPGHGAPEAVALVSLSLLLGIPLLTGYASWLEVTIIFLGLALLAFEIFIFPGHFVSGIAGILMIVVGLIMTFAGNEPSGPGVLPNMNGTIAAMQRGLLVVTLGMVCSLILWFWLSKYLPKIPYFNQMMLMPPGGDPTMMGALGADIVWPLVGQTGKAMTDLKPGGSAEFRDETMNDSRPVSVVTEGAFLRAGTDVTVTESRGSRVVVKAANA
ncbi:MAG: hypothetical protein H7Z14_14845 [Anaerolineae bacterium]|nr:hypothetical protein [Phycisphaerae bacterium]